jgi:hypothetical protein
MEGTLQGTYRILVFPGVLVQYGGGVVGIVYGRDRKVGPLYLITPIPVVLGSIPSTTLQPPYRG